jgi:glycogen synthase
MENKETVTITLDHYNQLRDTYQAFHNKDLFLKQQHNGYYFFTEVVEKEALLKSFIEKAKNLTDENQTLRSENHNLKYKNGGRGFKVFSWSDY